MWSALRFFQTNLLDSFRGPSPEMKHQVGKLLESSPISAADIADYIHAEVAKGSFLILPHEQARMAWRIKRQNPQAICDEMTASGRQDAGQASAPGLSGMAAGQQGAALHHCGAAQIVLAQGGAIE